MKDLDQGSSLVIFWEIEVVCNFKREKLLFHMNIISGVVNYCQ